MLTQEKVWETGALCMSERKDIKTLDQALADETLVVVKGPVATIAFEKARIDANRAAIDDLLDELPDAFHEGKGEGWSTTRMPLYWARVNSPYTNKITLAGDGGANE